MARATETQPYAGRDLKSVMLNLATVLIFLIPFVWYFITTPHMVQYYAAASIGTYLLAFVLPPTGWRKPHSYSDDPKNVPMGYKQH